LRVLRMALFWASNWGDEWMDGSAKLQSVTDSLLFITSASH